MGEEAYEEICRSEAYDDRPPELAMPCPATSETCRMSPGFCWNYGCAALALTNPQEHDDE